jgi:guanine nucleotide-binding protein subunit alpha
MSTVLLRANQRPPSALSGPEDAFAQALKPPEFQTDAERHAWLEREAEAKRISDLIDEEIRGEKERLKRTKQDVRVCFHLNIRQ